MKKERAKNVFNGKLVNLPQVEKHMYDEKHPKDVLLGQTIKRLRISKGITLTLLASGLELSYQQLQKYERGKSRITYSRLWEMCTLLGVSVVDVVNMVEEGGHGC